VTASLNGTPLLFIRSIRQVLTAKASAPRQEHVYPARGETTLNGFEDAVRLYEVR
jgi:hypothetical protein